MIPADWSLARNLVANLACPVLLAGGLNPESVGEAIAQTHPFGVDVSSGVEIDGIKDHGRMQQFIHVVRALSVATTIDGQTGASTVRTV